MSRRSLRNVALVAAAVACELLLRARGVAGVDVVRADFGVSAGVIAVVSLLSSLFTRFNGNSTDLGTKRAVEGMRSDVSSLSKTLTSLIVGVAGQVASTLGVVRRFLQRVFSKLYDMLANLVRRIARILDRIFGPIIDFLNRIKFHLKKIYDNVIRPIIDTIEFVRSFLRLMSFFGFEWSKKLDVQLQVLEQYVLAPYEWITVRLNEISNWINRIVTLDGLLQRVMLLQSLVRDVAYTSNLLWNAALAQPGHWGPPDTGITPPVSPARVTADMKLHFRTGGAPLSGAIRESIANVQINLRNAA